jgi:phosphate transport system ATP-binding protein
MDEGRPPPLDMTAILSAGLVAEAAHHRLDVQPLEPAETAGIPSASPVTPAVTLENVAVSFGGHVAVRKTTLALATHRVTALVGPSGCGKTSILRAINRLHDHTGGTVSGAIRLGELDVYAPATSSELVRSRVGMVFQRPNPFPTMSIFDNVVSGLRFNGIRSKSLLAEAGEAALRHAALWDIVKDRLRDPAIRLSGGQQQRLCIARALAVEPEVLLMDEPCSALDPVATGKIEALITELSAHVTVVLVTHNMFQAARVSDDTAVFLLGEDRVGELVEFGPTAQVFRVPKDERTRAYVTGHIG